MKILVACEFSGTVREAFRKKGHEVYSCDLLPSDDNSPYHIQGDVVELLNEGWDMMIAHPPCTYLTNSSAGWLYNKDGDPNIERWNDLYEGAKFFKLLAEAPIPKKCIENPIQLGYAQRVHGQGKPTQYVQPYHFGHLEQKTTGLWLYGLPMLTPTDDRKAQVKAMGQNDRNPLHMLSPSPDRWKARSVTYQGIADAMAAQWG